MSAKKEFVEKCIIASCANPNWEPPKDQEHMMMVIGYWEDLHDAIHGEEGDEE